eukprot:8479937-Heterocapsa_arctica.AAC.1
MAACSRTGHSPGDAPRAPGIPWPLPRASSPSLPARRPCRGTPRAFCRCGNPITRAGRKAVHALDSSASSYRGRRRSRALAAGTSGILPTLGSRVRPRESLLTASGKCMRCLSPGSCIPACLTHRS